MGLTTSLLSLYLWQRRAWRNGLIPSSSPSFLFPFFNECLRRASLLRHCSWSCQLDDFNQRRAERRRKKCRQRAIKGPPETCPPSFFQWHFDECGPMWWILNLYKIFFNFKSSISFRYERKWATYDILLNGKKERKTKLPEYDMLLCPISYPFILYIKSSLYIRVSAGRSNLFCKKKLIWVYIRIPKLPV